MATTPARQALRDLLDKRQIIVAPERMLRWRLRGASSAVSVLGSRGRQRGSMSNGTAKSHHELQECVVTGRPVGAAQRHG
jgi:hypothetical protein